MRCTYLKFLVFIGYLCFSQNSLIAQSDGIKAKEYAQNGEFLLLEGKPKKAIKFFRKAINTNKHLTAAWKGLGTCYELLEQYDSTVIQYEKVLTINPNFSRVLYYELGRGYYRTNQYQKAIDYFNQFEKLQAKPVHLFGINGEKEKKIEKDYLDNLSNSCLLYTSPSPRDRTRSRMPSSA